MPPPLSPSLAPSSQFGSDILRAIVLILVPLIPFRSAPALISYLCDSLIIPF